MIRGFADLEVFQSAYRHSLSLHKLTLQFPKYEQYGGLADQMRRASKSVAMNIAEGYGRKSSLAEFKRFLTIALGSNDEVLVQLMYCKDLGYIEISAYEGYEREYRIIGKQLRTMLETWQTWRR